MADESQQFSKFFNRQSRISHYSAHRYSVNRIVPGNRYNARTIRHHYMLALTNDTKACFLQRLDCLLMIYARYFGHPLNCHFHFAHFHIAGQFLDG